jgi:hypothetical protein
VTGGCLKDTVMYPHSLTVAGAAGELQQILLRTPFPFHLWFYSNQRHLLLFVRQITRTRCRRTDSAE